MAKGKRKGYIAPGRRDVYDALRRKGASKTKAAKIANAGADPGGHAKRVAMARKAAATRKRRKGKSGKSRGKKR